MLKSIIILSFIMFIFFSMHIKNIKAQEGPPLLQGNQYEVLSPQTPSTNWNIQAQENPPVPTPPPPNQGQALPVPPPSPPPPPGVRNLNIPYDRIMGNASKAILTAKKTLPFLTAGKVWISRAPAGEIEVKGAVVYKGMAVGAIHFSNENGNVLPVGFKTIDYNVRVPIETVKQNFDKILSQLKVIDGAEFCMPEYTWTIPVVFQDKIVFKLKIYYDGIHVVPDYPIDQEMRYQQ